MLTAVRGHNQLEVSVAKTAKPEAKQMGRPTVFKKDGPDVHGRISAAAGEKFEMYRDRLSALAKWPVDKRISDGDVIEFIIRGEVSTKLVLKGEL